MKEYCQGPGAKLIFHTKEEGLAELRRLRPGRRARPGQGSVKLCPWSLDHYHITSKRTTSKKRGK